MCGMWNESNTWWPRVRPIIANHYGGCWGGSGMSRLAINNGAKAAAGLSIPEWPM